MALQELIQIYPHISIIIFSFIVSFFITLVNYFILPKDKMHAMKARQKELQAEMKLHKDNPSKMMELQKEMMGQSMEMMKHSFKPMLITMLPILIFFNYLRGWYSATILGNHWIWWYIGASIAASIIFRKLFKMP